MSNRETTLLNGKVTLRPCDNGDFDVLFCENCSISMEMMDDNLLWIGIRFADEQYEVHVTVSARGALSVVAHEA